MLNQLKHFQLTKSLYIEVLKVEKKDEIISIIAYIIT